MTVFYPALRGAALLLLALAPAAAGAAGGAPALRLHADGKPLDPALQRELEGFVGIPTATTATVARTIAGWLAETTLFRRVTCAPSPAAIDCTLSPSTLVVDSEVRGSLPFDMLRADLERRTFLQQGVIVGTPTAAIEKQTARLRRSLRDDGYFDARIAAEAAPARAPTPLLGMTVALDVDPGPTAHLGAVTVNGPPLLEPGDLDLLKEYWLFRVAESRFRPAHFDDALEAMSARLRERGYPSARLRGRYELDRATERVNVTLDLDPGPRLELLFIGNRRLDGDALAEATTFAAAGSTDPSEVERSVAALRTAYQREGHYAPVIEPSTGVTADGHLRVAFTIEEGPRGFVEEVALRPVGELSEVSDALGALGLGDVELFTRSRGLLVSGAWVDEWVRHDERVLAEALAAVGYGAAQVKGERLATPGGSLIAAFVIDEGPRRTVGASELHGLPDDVDTTRLRRRLRLNPGRPFVEAELGADRREILAALAEGGYPHAEIARRVKQPYRDQSGEVTIDYTIEPGPRARLAGVLVVGAVDTSPSVVLDQLELSAGDPLGAAALVAAKQRLRALGTFRAVELRPLAATREAEDTWLLASVEERDRRQLFAVLGFSTNEFFSLGLDLTDRNLFGRAISATLEARFANASEVATTFKIGQRDRAVLRARAPRPFGLPFDVELSTQYDFINRPEIFVERRVGAQLTLLRTLRRRGIGPLEPGIVASLGYELTATETIIAEADVLGNDRPATIGRLIPRLSIEGRDSVLNPRAGYDAQVTFEAGPAALAGPFSSTAGNFWRALFQARGYVPLGPPLALRLDSGLTLGGPLVLALTAAYGLAHPLGPAPSNGGSAIPLSEAFSYGGDLSLRGLGEGASRLAFPGANYSFAASAELRFTAFEGGFGAIEVAGFGDLGTVAYHLGDLFRETTISVGPSLRYVTPIGPLSLAYGWPVLLPDRLVAGAGGAASSSGRLHIVFGARF